MNRVVYVVTGAERYALMAAVSAASLRRVQPGVEILVVTDSPGDGPGRGWPVLRRLADAVVQVPLGPGAPQLASRRLKTSLRATIDAPFLFLDVDTVVVRRLPSPPPGDRPAATLDRTHGEPWPGRPRWVEPHYRACGWGRPPRRYRNTGAIWWPASAHAESFGQGWQRRWEESLAHGLALDQPAFNAAAQQCGGVAELPPAGNALVEADPRLARGASVWHFFAGAGRGGVVPGRGTSLLECLVASLGERGEPDWSAWERARELEWPYGGQPWPAWRLALDVAGRGMRQRMLGLGRDVVRTVRRSRAGDGPLPRVSGA